MRNRIIVLILAILLISIMMPKWIIMELSITRGEKWTDPTLVAPFDIPLLKSDLQLKEDKNIIEFNYEPIYILDTNYIDGIKDSVARQIYRKGIISQVEAGNIQSGAIRIQDGNVLRHINLSDLTTDVDVNRILQENNVSTTQKIPSSLRYDERLNHIEKEALSKKISSTNGLIHEGEIIVSENQIIDVDTELRINSYVNEYKKRMGADVWWLLITFGRFIIITFILLINVAYIQIFNKQENVPFKEFAFILGSYVIIPMALVLAHQILHVSLYTVPVIIVPIIFLMFFGTKTAIVGNVTISIISALFCEIPFEFFTINFMSGMAAIIILRNFYRHKELFKAIAFIITIEITLYIAFQLVKGYTIVGTTTIKAILTFVINNILLLGLHQIIYLLEKVFKFVSNVTLLENSDTNQPLLSELSHKAPGTFQHSVQVANLAEAAAKKIGANPLLARCGALYHDIGKMKNPQFFIENINGSNNPHDNLTPENSADILKKHVTDGLEIAKEHSLPDCITRFIETHHGNSLTSYFYLKAQKLSPDKEINKEIFSYPGNNPESKEESICMICDTIEAASRSLPSYDQESIDNLVEKLIEKQIESGYFKNSKLTFYEISQIKETLKENLHNIYHVRIAYPN